jgi:hypothetical protein
MNASHNDWLIRRFEVEWLDPVKLEMQRLHGGPAARRSYTSVEMSDEHGTTYLCLPGCTIRLASDHD